VEEAARRVGEAEMSNEIETKALRLLQEVNERQARGIAGAMVRPYLCAHLAGLEANTGLYEETLEFLVEAEALLRHETEQRAFRITERGVDMAQQTEREEPVREPLESPVTDAEPVHREEPFTREERPHETTQPRPWWSRILGG
jgi:hypothetical protein